MCNSDRSVFAQLNLARKLMDVADFVELFHPLFLHELARCSKLYITLVADKKLDIQFLLQSLDLPT
ncbi:hypothetical protein D3C73_1553380 [compost metagenome]